MAINWDRKPYTLDQFTEAFSSNSRWADLADDLGIARRKGYIEPLRRAANSLGLDHSHYSSDKYTREILQEAVGKSTSVAGVLRYLGMKQAGGTQAHIARMIKKYSIDTSHFLGQAVNKGKTFTKKSTEEILVLGEELSNRVTPRILRRALKEIGVSYECAHCGCPPHWNDKPLTLEVNHINGMFWDNRRENLELLCPNCHSQDENSSSSHKFREKSEDKAGEQEGANL